MNPRAPGRPRTFNREQALEAAMKLFWRHGYEGISLADLTAAMGIKSPSLYAAFGSKEELYSQALDLYLAQLSQTLGDAFERATSIRAGMARSLSDMARAFTRPGLPPGCMIGIGSLRCGGDLQSVTAKPTALRNLAQAQLQARLEQAKEQGELAPGTETATLAAYFAAVIEGMSVQAQDGADCSQLIAIAELAMKAWVPI